MPDDGAKSEPRREEFQELLTVAHVADMQHSQTKDYVLVSTIYTENVLEEYCDKSYQFPENDCFKRNLIMHIYAYFFDVIFIVIYVNL